MPAPLRRYHAATRAAPMVAMTIVPLVFIYGFGLMGVSPAARSGVDVVTGAVLGHGGRDVYIALQLALAVALIGYAVARLGADTLRHARLAPLVVAESAGYGLALGSVIHFVLDQLAVAPLAIGLAETAERAVMSAGAGLHEELIFRLALVPLIAWTLIRTLDMGRTSALVLAVILSSLLFAAAHHLAGEPFELYHFAFRTLAGLLFAALFLWRGFGVAAWTHASYDFYVLGAM